MAQSAVDPASFGHRSGNRARWAETPAPGCPTNLLLVVDDAPFLRCLLDLAATLGLDARVERDSSDAILAYRTNWTPHLIVLDQLMPRSDLYATIRALRAAFGVPVLAITGEASPVFAPEPGALLLGRNTVIAEIHRRTRHARSSDAVLTIGRLSLDRAAGGASLDGQPLRLNPDEAATLAMLMQHEGSVVHRHALIAALGGLQRDLDPRVIDVHVIRLMVALGASAPVRIERSHDRAGYVLHRAIPDPAPAPAGG